MDGLPRAQWVAWFTALLLTVASALMLSGTGALVPRAEQAVATTVSPGQLMAEGDRRLAAGDFSGALQVYDDALMRDPSDVGLYYRAGAALSHLKEREQAVAMFLWVVRHGPPEREEVRLAREWLEAARVLAPVETRPRRAP
jgi:tetratricopeptide (TPR) repeat protein